MATTAVSRSADGLIADLVDRFEEVKHVDEILRHVTSDHAGRSGHTV